MNVFIIMCPELPIFKLKNTPHKQTHTLGRLLYVPIALRSKFTLAQLIFCNYYSKRYFNHIQALTSCGYTPCAFNRLP